MVVLGERPLSTDFSETFKEKLVVEKDFEKPENEKRKEAGGVLAKRGKGELSKRIESSAAQFLSEKSFKGMNFTDKTVSAHKASSGQTGIASSLKSIE